GIGVFYSSNPIIRNNLIVDNAGSAGISVSSSKPVIVNNTITGNISTSLFSGGIDCFSSYPAIIENNIIASNGDSFGIYASDAIPTIRHNNVWGHKDGNYNSIIGDRTAIDGNVSVDPEFAGVDDFRLALSSPCINAGDPNRIPEIQTTDYYGNSRLLGNCIDIGASEVYPAWNTTSEEQYASIQDAIDDAGAFDVIVLTRGRHVGQGNRDIDTAGKAVTVRSVDPQDAEIVANTIIDSQGSPQEPHRGFYFHSGENANTILDGLTITGGGGAYEGGAISCTNGSSPAIRNCDIRNNHVTENGGGVFSRNSRPNITNCIIADNSANGENRHGGGAYFCTDGAATPSNAVVANCTVIGNSAGGRGGGLDACWSNPAYINCTIVGNTARQGGGASSFNQADPSIVNCIVRDNRALYGSQLAMINTLESQGVNTTTSMSVGHSDIQGYTDEVYIDVECILSWSSGNFDMDPDFVDSGYWDDADTVAEPNDDVFISGNYHLLPTSPCINAGNNNPLEPLPAVDIDGETRISDDTVDVGVDEVVIKPADLDLNGRVDMQDMLVVITQWLITGPEMQGDLNKDSFIDNADYAGVAEQWLWKGGWHQESP
ncbi:MAG: right-handed parallel beta-helix repeat-containing protein, partial [Planctomycetes bacterium]|nr:right-handed parallel beta-helix repeat-containing protein [Planctomycetota bacterium]